MSLYGRVVCEADYGTDATRWAKHWSHLSRDESKEVQTIIDGVVYDYTHSRLFAVKVRAALLKAGYEPAL